MTCSSRDVYIPDKQLGAAFAQSSRDPETEVTVTRWLQTEISEGVKPVKVENITNSYRRNRKTDIIWEWYQRLQLLRKTA